MPIGSQLLCSRTGRHCKRLDNGFVADRKGVRNTFCSRRARDIFRTDLLHDLLILPSRLFNASQALQQNSRTWALQVIKVNELTETHKAEAYATELYKSTRHNVEAKLLPEMYDGLSLAVNAGSGWRSKRQTGPGASIQAALTSFGRFLENFSGIAEIAKAADQHYGGLAYGTLSLLVTVFVRKSKHEDDYLDAFDELSYAFPRLETLHRLEPHQQLQRLIAVTFAGVIQFAREVTSYYSSKRNRYVSAFKPEREQMRTLNEIRSNLRQIRNECDIFMIQEIKDLRLEVGKMSAQLKTVDSGVQQTKTHLLVHMNSEDTTYLSNLRTQLNVNARSPHLDLKQYRFLLEEEFSPENLQLKHDHPRATSIELLEGDSSFSDWSRSDESRLLLLGGTNVEDSVGYHNWMSIGAVLVVERLQEEQKKVAYFLTQPSHSSSSAANLQSMVASILYQLALIHPTRLRSNSWMLQSLINSPDWNDDGDFKKLLEQIEQTFEAVLGDFENNDEVYIVVDRLDQCDWGENRVDSFWKLRDVLYALLQIVTHASCVVKILLTVDAWSSRRYEQRKLAGLSSRQKKRLLIKADWVQEIEEND